MSFLGATLPGWRFHLEASFHEAGNYFLILAVGFVAASGTLHFVMSSRWSRFVLVLANVLTCGGFLLLAASSLLEGFVVRLLGFLCIGAGAGWYRGAMFESIKAGYASGRSTITGLAGVLFGSGCLLTAVLMAGTYSTYPVAVILVLLAVLPGVAAIWFARAKFPAADAASRLTPSEIWHDFKNPGVVLFSLLLFFQVGGEWSIAGWLPLFLIRRLGMSPQRSLLILALYWMALLAGRVVSQWVIPRISGAALLAGSIISALLGTVVLASTNNDFGAVMGVIFAGAGFAPIFPLVLQKIGRRFPGYQPGVLSGLFSVAALGGLLAPWLVSFLASAWGIQAVMFFPMVGTFSVLVLTLLILLESKLSGSQELKETGL